MVSRIRLVDVTKLRKTSGLVAVQSQKVVNQANERIKTQADFMNRVGMDRKKLRDFINNDTWSAKHKHIARQELIRWNEGVKAEIAADVSLKRKELRMSARLLNPLNKPSQTTRRRRTGFV